MFRKGPLKLGPLRKFEHLRSRRFFISMLDLETFSFLLFERLVIGDLFAGIARAGLLACARKRPYSAIDGRTMTATTVSLLSWAAKNLNTLNWCFMPVAL